MKYNYFKIFKFSTVTKKIDHISDSFLSINKKIKKIPFYVTNHLNLIYENILLNGKKTIKYLLKYTLLNFNKVIKFIIYNFFKDYILSNIKKISFNKPYRSINFRKYNFYTINKKIKDSLIYYVFFIILIGFVYLAVPKFYSYDKLKIEKIICGNNEINCLIKGKVYYSFYPTPRIKINDLVVNDTSKNKHTLLKAKNVEINISIKNLLRKESHKYKKIKFNIFEINANVQNLKNYKLIFEKKSNFIPITFENGKIIFFDGKSYVATINDTNLYLKTVKDSFSAKLKGKFLNDDIYINLNSKLVNAESVTDIILKMSEMNFLSKVNIISSEDNNIASGNFLIKKGKNRITAPFDYKNNEIIINESNLSNAFLEGSLDGKILFLPYFNFNLDVSLKSINFTKLYNYFLSLDEKKQKNFFKINNKINGKLSLSSDKIYSSHNLVKSLESRVKFNNGSILVEQLLVNLGKLGALDLLGAINNDKKFTNFKFESNIFIDNEKKFLSKFGIYNKKNVSSNFFVSGNLDLENLNASFYEISGREKLNDNDINFIEKEFNNSMLIDGFESLFIFPTFKDFIKSTTME
mgnify:CR=1 FL=1